MNIKEIDIETFRDEIKGKKIRLTLESDNTNNVLSPISCSIEFEKIIVDVIFPASIHFFGEGRTARLSQINSIFKEEKHGIVTYKLNCGKFTQINKDYILECL